MYPVIPAKAGIYPRLWRLARYLQDTLVIHDDRVLAEIAPELLAVEQFLLRFLGQELPEANSGATPGEILDWAIGHWNRMSLRGCGKRPAPAGYLAD